MTKAAVTHLSLVQCGCVFFFLRQFHRRGVVESEGRCLFNFTRISQFSGGFVSQGIRERTRMVVLTASASLYQDAGSDGRGHQGGTGGDGAFRSVS